ncbi:hypothetical protein A2645_01375 [Candidatus Nomurabacteria bacterium RIFCSPHIGHO2_01_FULL_39_9]|uniref:Glycosyltransferase subfamily 4-like N-terminal domain-containing protein n=1 Tax=Candidatus Nomurabacteria bacterium RIFCSPHIGHO2_01_FULL_39_9 TaxID=1801735 RepID=A0A1F6UXT8_9BACT|nr:MAG: hypothetical protein A2645_01375 [Candidatus Nomurabacteria bacterium RIFCSPHIGHO2_01_FULL_39_9]
MVSTTSPCAKDVFFCLAMKKKIKICFVCLGAYPLFNQNIKATFGGAEVQLYLLGKALTKLPEFEVSFVVANFGQPAVEVRDGVRLYKSIKNEKSGSLWRSLRRPKPLVLANVLRKIGADIYIQRTASAGTGLVCLVAHLLGKKFIYMTAHEIDCGGEFEKMNPWLSGRLYRYGIRRADLVITQNEEHRRMVKEHHGKESIVVKSVYKIPKSSELDQMERKYILWVGRAEDWKQPEIFLELARNFKDHNFLMICPRSNNQHAYFDGIKERVAELPNVSFKDFVPFAEMDNYFRQAKVYVLTSKFEGFPNTFVQAAKNTVPILSLNVDPDDFLEKYDCGIFTGGSIDKLKDSLHKILNDEVKRARLGANAYRYAKENHDIEKIINNYKTILEKL